MEKVREREMRVGKERGGRKTEREGGERRGEWREEREN
jgi:hypothetical protein